MTAELSGQRRAEVLDGALRTFARFGYRKTSMDDVAKEARISRPGLYFLFNSKSELFRAAAERGIELDLAAVEHALATPGMRLQERIVNAFDSWAGRYIGPLRDTSSFIEEDPDLLGPTALAAPRRFEALVTAALEQTELPAEPSVVVRTLISVSIGLKHQKTNRDEYRARMRDAIRLMTPPD